MKKFIFSAFAILVFGLINAQDIRYGVKAGINLSNFSGDTETKYFGSYKSKTGYNIALFGEFLL